MMRQSFYNVCTGCQIYIKAVLFCQTRQAIDVIVERHFIVTNRQKPIDGLSNPLHHSSSIEEIVLGKRHIPAIAAKKFICTVAVQNYFYMFAGFTAYIPSGYGRGVGKWLSVIGKYLLNIVLQIAKINVDFSMVRLNLIGYQLC